MVRTEMELDYEDEHEMVIRRGGGADLAADGKRRNDPYQYGHVDWASAQEEEDFHM